MSYLSEHRSTFLKAFSFIFFGGCFFFFFGFRLGGRFKKPNSRLVANTWATPTRTSTSSPPSKQNSTAESRGFFIFYFRFSQRYIFDLEIYRNIPRSPRCRAAGNWPPGSEAAGAFLKKNSRRKLRAGPWGPAARQL